MGVMTRRVTADNFLEVASLPEYVDQNIELVNGEIVSMPVTNTEHAETVGRLAVYVGWFAMQNNSGRLYVGDAGIVLERDEVDGDTVRGLDLAFVSYDKAPMRLPTRLIEIAPDLAIEVMSPSNTVGYTRRKIRQLLSMGCPQVWIVHPDLREVDVHSADGGVATYRDGDTLDASDVLPGFTIAVSDIFAK